jgi:hypothetical protein
MNDGAKFCDKCGASVEKKVNLQSPLITKRDIVVAIILTFVTCGIYGIYWFIVMTDDVNSLSDEKMASGGTAFLYSILTCGIYALYWNYKIGQKMAEAGKKYNKPINDNSVLYLVLSIFGLGLVNYCLIQSDLNRFAD